MIIMPKKQRYSLEYVAFLTLEYLLTKKDGKLVSKHHIINQAGIPSQRADRFNNILNLLLEKGWVSMIETEYVTYYKVTEAGEKEYNLWIKNFLQFAEVVYQPHMKTRIHSVKSA